MKHFCGIFLGCIVLLFFFSFSITVGASKIPLSAIWEILGRNFSSLPSAWVEIILNVRLPRSLAAILIGGALAISGAVCQGVFHNPLAEPYLLGISSGASLGASLGIILNTSFSFQGLGSITILAFTGSLAVALTVILVAGETARQNTNSLLFSGIAFSFICQALIWMIMTLNRERAGRIIFWVLGSFSLSSWREVLWLSVITIPTTLWLSLNSRNIDILSMGYGEAYSLGLKPERTVFINLILIILCTAICVSVAGSIGFVGLIIPHLVRMSGNASYRKIIPFSWLGGAVLMLVSDIIARNLRPPTEIPVGVITALMGAPFLLLFLKRQSMKASVK